MTSSGVGFGEGVGEELGDGEGLGETDGDGNGVGEGAGVGDGVATTKTADDCKPLADAAMLVVPPRIACANPSAPTVATALLLDSQTKITLLSSRPS